MLVHKHLIITGTIRSAPTDTDFVEAWITRLVDLLNMKIMMGPISGYSPIVGNRGVTCAVIIETSHIVLHTWDEENPAMLQLDVYSCGEFGVEDVLQHLEVFDPIKLEYKFLDRESGLQVINTGVYLS